MPNIDDTSQNLLRLRLSSPTSNASLPMKTNDNIPNEIRQTSKYLDNNNDNNKDNDEDTEPSSSARDRNNSERVDALLMELFPDRAALFAPHLIQNKKNKPKHTKRQVITNQSIY